METTFGQTSRVSLPLALVSVVSLANGGSVDLLVLKQRIYSSFVDK